ncbi:MAG: hypothetical protein ACYCX4_01700 [Bacillota bacterium]
MNALIKSWDEMKPNLVKSFEALGREFFGDPEFSGDKVVQDLAMELAKALGTANLGAGIGDGTPLRLQNLDATMTSILYTEAHLKLFNWINKVPSIQPYYEFNKRKAYGSSRGIMGFKEGGAPKGSVAQYERTGKYVKYMGVRGGVTHQMTLTGQLGGSQVDPVAEENRNRTLELLEKVERQIVWGDERIKDAGANTVLYDGIIRQLEQQKADNVIDLKGKYLDFSNLDEAALKLVEEGKMLNFANLRAFMKPTVLTDLGRLKYETERKALGSSNVDYITGVPLKGHDTQFGPIPFEPSILLEEVEGSKPLATADDQSPAAPGAVAGVAGAVGGGETSKFEATDAATYYYFAAAFNESGESLTTASAGVAVVVGQKVTVTINRVNGAVGYRVYRAIVNDATKSGFIGKVAQPDAGNATFTDLNEWRPGTGICTIVERSSENLVIAQMTPLIKFPLAVVSTTIEWLYLLYHVLVVKAPERQIVFKNIGRLT